MRCDWRLLPDGRVKTRESEVEDSGGGTDLITESSQSSRISSQRFVKVSLDDFQLLPSSGKR